MKRRDMLRMTGAGCLAGLLLPDSGAVADPDFAADQEKNHPANMGSSDLIQTSKRTAAASEGISEDYFWHDSRTLLFLRRSPGKTVFRAVLVDEVTGRTTLPQAFNERNSSLMESGRMMLYAGKTNGEMQFLPPLAAMSPDGKWLLWESVPLPPGKREWVASALDSHQQKWAKGVDPVSETDGLGGHALWMPDSNHWVELVTRYRKRAYSVSIANIHQLGKPAAVRTIRPLYLDDGLAAGIRQDRTVVMHNPDHHSDRRVTELVLSLFSLDEDYPVAWKLNVPIRQSNSVSDVTLSPKGDRLAWVLALESGRARVHTLYVADADGAHAKKIGSADRVLIGTHYSWPRELRWLPNLKQVSFVYKNMVYICSV